MLGQRPAHAATDATAAPVRSGGRTSRVLSWHARGAESAYAPGGRGFNEAQTMAQTSFQLHASSCV